MTRFRFELATPDDDAGLREVLRETTMPGTIGLQFLREPSFFESNCVLGGFHQTLLCRDTNSGEIVGCGCRSVRELNVDGRLQPVGYLSLLRGKKPFRSLGLVARGYRFMRELHQDGRAKFYLTTIAEGNDQAIGLLTSGRAGLPIYDFAGNYETFAVPCRGATKRKLKSVSSRGSAIRSASESDVPAIVNFLQGQSFNRNYFPNYQESDFLGDEKLFRNLNLEDMLLATDAAGDIVGTMGLWDQRSFRQTVVSGYQGALNHLRPIYNAWATLSGRIRLPQSGQRLNYACVAIPVVRELDCFAHLLEGVLERATEAGLEYVLLGCHQSDEQWPVVKQVSERSYRTRLYRVHWTNGHSETELESSIGGEQNHPRVKSPYLELGSL